MVLGPSAKQIFAQFIKAKGDGSLDVSQVFETACFKKWLESRPSKPIYPEEAFRKALVSHCKSFHYACKQK